jgi:hypothetical protein
MDLQTARSSGLNWSWARNAAIVVFVVAGILLVASLTAARSSHAETQTTALAAHILHHVGHRVGVL